MTTRQAKKMASPMKLLKTKQSTPLPSQFLPYQDTSCNNVAGGSTSVKREDEPATTRPKSMELTRSAHNLSYNKITGECVKDFLRCHKSFLEDFLLNEVQVAVLQKILKRKTCRVESGREVATLIGGGISKLKTQEQSPCQQPWMGGVTSDIQKGLPFKSVLFHLCEATAEAAYADCFQLYLLQSDSLVHMKGEALIPQALTIPVRLGDTIPGYVATTKTSISVNLIKQKNDFKFPNGSALQAEDLNMAFILATPILSTSGDLIGVLELGRKASSLKFAEEDKEMATSYLSWVTVVLDCTNIYFENQQLQLMFGSFDKIMSQVIGNNWTFQSLFECMRTTVNNLVGSENTSIFMTSRTGQDLSLQLPSSNLFDRLISSESNEAMFSEDANKLDVLSQSDIVFPGLSVIKRVADHAAKTGEVISLNEITRKKFIPADNKMALENCKTILCAPMMSNQKVLGVVVAFNKIKSTEFSTLDKNHFTSFCEFCSLILNNCKAQKDLYRTTNKFKVANEVLEYHRICSEEEFQDVKRKLALLEDYPIKDFAFDSVSRSTITKAQLSALMFYDLVDTTPFNKDKILRFCLTVSRNYRPIPYHNWEHAFSVAHCLYCVMVGVPDMFTEIEKMGLFVACLCHDLDHRGTNSSFLAKTGSPLGLLYGYPIVENHHYNQAVALLQMDSINVFSHLTQQEYYKVLCIIRKAIMASDIMQFFKNKETMMKLNNEGVFNWDNPTHREVAHRMLITMCDLNSTFKPWDIYKEQVDMLFEEFYNQGDVEKKLGMEPLTLMDRNFRHTIPDIQISFLGTFSLASTTLLEPVFPHVQELRERAEDNIAKWKELIRSETETCTDTEVGRDTEIGMETRRGTEHESIFTGTRSHSIITTGPETRSPSLVAGSPVAPGTRSPSLVTGGSAGELESRHRSPIFEYHDNNM